MGGLVLDVIVALMIKSALRLRRSWGSSKWPLVQAHVDSSRLGGGWVWNCPTVYVTYTYNFAGQAYSAIDSKPYFIKASAEDRVDLFCAGKTPVVRVNPAHPENSVLEKADQWS